MENQNMIVSIFLKKMSSKRAFIDIEPAEATALDNKIYEVEQYLVASYGTPQTDSVNGKKYRFINDNLESFSTSFDCFLKHLKACDIDINNYIKELFLILDYCKVDDKLNFKKFVSKIENSENISAVIKKILAELTTMVNTKLDAIKVEQCFKNVLKIKNDYYDCIGYRTYRHHFDNLEKLETLVEMQEEN